MTRPTIHPAETEGLVPVVKRIASCVERAERYPNQACNLTVSEVRELHETIAQLRFDLAEQRAAMSAIAPRLSDAVFDLRNEVEHTNSVKVSYRLERLGEDLAQLAQIAELAAEVPQ